MENIKIGTREVGKGRPCFIIAEAGVNHNGKFALAKKLVDAAALTGADAVKFQAFKSEDLATEKAEMAGYQEKSLGKKTQREMLKKYELRLEDFEKLKEYCDEKGILFLATPHTGAKVLDFVDKLVPSFKIGSGDVTNLPFLEEVALKGKPIILSTGMSTMKEVKDALEVIYKTGNRKVVVLHCTTNYPCSFNEVNLRAMKAMQKELDCLVGYSDHTTGTTVPVMAAALGAVVIEKHFTLDKSLPGPDHKASLEQDEFREMVESIRNAELALGSCEKSPAESEVGMMKHARKSIVAAVDLEKGTRVTKEMLSAKRPGTGLSPALVSMVLGKEAKRGIKKGELILLGDLQ